MHLARRSFFSFFLIIDFVFDISAPNETIDCFCLLYETELKHIALAWPPPKIMPCYRHHTKEFLLDNVRPNIDLMFSTDNRIQPDSASERGLCIR